MPADKTNHHEIDLFWDRCAWVAQFKPGGPDICAQGDTPDRALRRLAKTASAEKLEFGGWNKIPIRPEASIPLDHEMTLREAGDDLEKMRSTKEP